MNTNLRRFLGLAAFGIALVTSAVPTWAGRVSTDRVVIGGNQFSRWAMGNLVDVRYSADTSNEQIGCKSHTLSTYSWTTCHARDSMGRSLVCGSGDWKFLDLVQGMTDSSTISFEIDGTSNVGACRTIRIYNSSELLK